MQFIINVDDFWLDSESDLEPALKKYIINAVVTEIKKSIESKINDAVTKFAKEEIEKSLYRDIQKSVKEVVMTGMVKKESYSDKGLVPIKDYITEMFQSNTGYRSPVETIKELAKKLGDEMKQRYDLLFASQIVAKLNENGLLKEDAAKMLLQSFEKK